MNDYIFAAETERLRLIALRDLQILDTAAEQEFDDLTRLAVDICQTPISLISLVDSERLWFKSKVGLDVAEIPRRESFCAHAISQSDVFIVPDAAADARFAHNSLVTSDLHFRFYAGAPLTTDHGHRLGSFCVIDRTKRRLSSTQTNALQALARQTVKLMTLSYQTGFLAQTVKSLARVNESLEQSRAQYRFFTQVVPQKMWTTLPDGQFDYSNSIVSDDCFGLQTSGAPITESNFHVLHPDDQLRVSEEWKQAVAAGKPYQTELRLLCGGKYRWHLTQAAPLRDQSDTIIKWIGTDTDIHERKTWQIAAFQARIRAAEYQSLFCRVNEAVLILESNNEVVLEVNERACQMYGYSRSEFIGRRLIDVSQNHALNGDPATPQSGDRRATDKSEIIHQRCDGTLFTVAANQAAIEYHGRPAILSINRDITDSNRLESQLRHHAFHDHLTGLPNRAMFTHQLTLALTRKTRDTALLCAVLFLDFDGFKAINDQFGHSTGDELLVMIAERIALCLRPGDLFARLGGDEFTILLDGLTEEADVLPVVERIQDQLADGFIIGAQNIAMSVSIGIAYNTAQISAEEMLCNADTAMYRAKYEGKASHRVYEPTMKM